MATSRARLRRDPDELEPFARVDLARERELRAAFEAVRKFSDDAIGRSSLGKVDFGSIIRRARVDVLGLRLDRDCGGTDAIAVDSAINDTELPHGNPEETIVRLIQRMTRAGFALAAYLNPRQASVVFATPWLAKAVRQEVQRHLALLETRLAEQRDQARSRLSFRVLADPISPTRSCSRCCSTSMRSRTRGRTGGPPQPATSPGGAGYGSARRGSDRPLTATTKEGGRIGEHVRRTMAQLAASGRLTARIVGDLLDPRYCKARFNLRYPFLKPLDRSVPLARQANDRHGRGRYWKKPLRLGDHEFLMFSQWFVWQRGAFDAWVRDIERGNFGGPT